MTDTQRKEYMEKLRSNADLIFSALGWESRESKKQHLFLKQVQYISNIFGKSNIQDLDESLWILIVEYCAIETEFNNNMLISLALNWALSENSDLLSKITIKNIEAKKNIVINGKEYNLASKEIFTQLLNKWNDQDYREELKCKIKASNTSLSEWELEDALCINQIHQANMLCPGILENFLKERRLDLTLPYYNDEGEIYALTYELSDEGINVSFPDSDSDELIWILRNIKEYPRRIMQHFLSFSTEKEGDFFSNLISNLNVDTAIKKSGKDLKKAVSSRMS